MTVLSKNLKRLRTAKHMTQEQAAQNLGVSVQTVSRWECGITLPDAVMLPSIARLYCVTIDDLYRETSAPYDNYAQRLGSVFEASLKPEDFLMADREYRKLLRTDGYTTKDLRLYGILYQHMMHVCIQKAEALYDRAIREDPERDPDTYWAARRQKSFFLWEIGRNQENIAQYLPLVEGGSDELQEWICLIQAYSFAGELDTAWEWVRRAEARFPENAALHIYSGDLLRAMKRYDDAFRHWERAMEMEPEWCDAAYSMASCYEELGEYKKAQEAYHQIADNLEQLGFDKEAVLPRSLAHRCGEKT